MVISLCGAGRFGRVTDGTEQDPSSRHRRRELGCVIDDNRLPSSRTDQEDADEQHPRRRAQSGRTDARPSHGWLAVGGTSVLDDFARSGTWARSTTGPADILATRVTRQRVTVDEGEVVNEPVAA